MQSPFIGEMLGTLVMILLGNGVVANVLLEKSKGQNSGWIVITTGWACAVLAGVFISTALGGPGHLNPAVSVAAALSTGDWAHTAVLSAAQMLGAFLGAALVWLQYLPHWGPTKDQGLKLACFCTAPAIKSKANWLSEIIGTCVLVVVAGAIFSKHVAATGPVAGLGPFLVAMLVWGIGLSLGGPTGYAINPARDLGPRIAHAVLPIAGKGSSDWGYAIVPVIGPVIGAVLGAIVTMALAI